MANYEFYNPNPLGKRVGDCAVRAISKALNTSWAKAYLKLVIQGFMMCDLPSANAVWGNLLKSKGFKKHIIPDTCPDCYTLADFCNDNQSGTYVIALSGHVVTAVDGVVYDTWDSSNETPIYYWSRKED